MFLWSTLKPHNSHRTIIDVCDLNIVGDHVHLFMTTIFLISYCIYQLDYASFSESKIVKEFFKEHAREFRVMSWPLNSPDMNSMEHL